MANDSDTTELMAENGRLRDALEKARLVIANYWPLVGPEAEPEKSTIEVLNEIDAALRVNQ